MKLPSMRLKTGLPFIILYLFKPHIHSPMAFFLFVQFLQSIIFYFFCENVQTVCSFYLKIIPTKKKDIY